ncbi:VanZ family protein [Rhodocista pekingensis]|uniref:VanZ family protein n=1 Tax=Rhodocista pekingensis TaxID=201185 RepID=A0ABW2KT29_9PROT
MILPLRLPAAAAALVCLAAVLYGSLHPFRFVWPETGAAAAWLSAGTEGSHPAEMLVNLLLYAPTAALAVAAWGGVSMRRAALLAGFGGFLLSLGVETVQAVMPDRTSSLLDLGLNTLGAALGGILGAVVAPRLVRGWSLRRLAAQPFVLLLLAAVAGYRLYPYVPSLEPDHVWAGFYYAFDLHTAPPLTVLRGTVTWLTLAVLVEALSGRRLARLAAPLAIALLLVAAVTLDRNRLYASDLLAALLGGLLWAVVPWRRGPWRWLLAGLAAAAIVAGRLRAGDALADPLAGLVPFAELRERHLTAVFLALFEKTFRLGSVLWLLWSAGLDRRRAALGFAGLLLLGEAVRAVAGGVPLTTDAVLVLILAGVWGLLEPARPPPVTVPRHGCGARDTLPSRSL